MFRPAINKILPFITKRFTTHCDAGLEENVSSSAPQSQPESKIRTPMQFENLRGILNQGYVNNYDGFRMVVQKQVNLNTVVSHFYWIGSSATQQPIYQYRLILPFDEKVANVSCDADFNIEGELKYPINSNVHLKSNFNYGDQQKSASVDVELTDSSSATMFQVDTESNLSLSYMQSVTPNLILGGLGTYSNKSKKITTAFGGQINVGDNTITGQWDNNFHLLYLRKVNQNRVHLMSDLMVDEQGNSTMTLSAEYSLKQSKIHVGVDSNLLIKSTVDSTVSPGVTLQFAAEMMQAKGHYKFGYGIMMG